MKTKTFYWLAGSLTLVLVFVVGGAVGAATPAQPPKPVTITERYVPNACAVALNLADERQRLVDAVIQNAVDFEANPDGIPRTNTQSGQAEIAALTAKYQVARDECLK